jgi:hypothetical protein
MCRQAYPLLSETTPGNSLDVGCWQILLQKTVQVRREQ